MHSENTSHHTSIKILISNHKCLETCRVLNKNADEWEKYFEVNQIEISIEICLREMRHLHSAARISFYLNFIVHYLNRHNEHYCSILLMLKAQANHSQKLFLFKSR